MFDINTLCKKTIVSFFDEEYYLSYNNDVKESGKDPLMHFIKNGFKEERSPCAWIDIRYCKLLAKREGRNLSSIEEFVHFYLNMSSNSLLGPSPLFCPIWIANQLGVETKNLTALAMGKVDHTKQISWHPFLFYEYPSYTVLCLSDWIKEIDKKEKIGNLLIDIRLYIHHHKDLHQFNDNPKKAFMHFLRRGIFENRLHYMGIRYSPQAPSFLIFLRVVLLLILNLIKKQDLQLKYKIKHLNSDICINDSIEMNFYSFEEKLLQITNQLNPSSSYLGENIETGVNLLLNEYKSLINDQYYYVKKNSNNERPDIYIKDIDLFSGRHKASTNTVLYCVNIGDHDDFPEVIPMEDCSYYLITDSFDAPSGAIPWIIVRPSVNEIEIKRICLWYKTHPYILFPETQYTIWIDSNITLHHSADKIFKTHKLLSEIAVMTHKERNCIYQECDTVIQLGLDKEDVVNKVKAELKASGMPPHYGLYETNILYSNNQDMNVRRFYRTWWSKIVSGSRRDQLSFTYAAWINNLCITPLDFQRHIQNSRFFSKREHLYPKTRKV